MAEVSGKYTVAFRGSKFPAQKLGIYYWDTTPNGPFAAFEEGDLVPSIELAPPQTPFSGAIGNSIEGGVPPAISANGHIAQIVELSSISPFFTGTGVVRHIIGTGVETVTHNSSQPVNGATYLLDTITRPVSIDATGTVGIRCLIKTAAGGSAGSGVFREATTGINKVAVSGDPAPGTLPASTTFSVIGGSTLNEREQQWNSSNKPAFYATTTASGSNAIGANGIWTETASGVVAIALSNEVAWSLLSDKWSTLDSPSINDSGDIAFRACLTTSACGNEGIWAKIGGVELLVAKNDDTAPSPTGASTSEFFVDFGMPVIDAQGRIAFWATTDSAGNPQGIWIADGTGPTGIRRIARKDDVVRGTSSNFETFEKDLGIADTGQVAFKATLEDNSKGLFVESEYHTLIKLARTTEQFPLPNGTAPIVQNIVFYPGASPQGVGGLYGNPNSLPDSVGVAFQLAFPNGQSAVVLTTVGP